MIEAMQSSSIQTEAIEDDSKFRARRALEAAPGLTQVGLAKKLGMQQSNVNKILQSENTHPMTLRFAKGLAEYVGSTLDDIFGPHSLFSIVATEDEVIGDTEAPPELFAESLSHLVQYFQGLGLQPKRKRLHELAELVATELNMEPATCRDHQAVISRVLALEAGKA